MPLRLEIGPKDIEKSQVMLARRDTREKSSAAMDGLASHVVGMLESIQHALFDRAVAFRDDHTTHTDSYDEFKQIMEGRPGFVVSPWCGSGVRGRDQSRDAGDDSQHSVYGTTVAGKKCLKCDAEATVQAWFAKSY